jgi:hypothetical protein
MNNLNMDTMVSWLAKRIALMNPHAVITGPYLIQILLGEKEVGKPYNTYPAMVKEGTLKKLFFPVYCNKRTHWSAVFIDIENRQWNHSAYSHKANLYCLLSDHTIMGSEEYLR